MFDVEPFIDDLTPRRSVRLGMRVTPEERAAWEATAQSAGVSLSRYVRAMVRAARSEQGQ